MLARRFVVFLLDPLLGRESHLGESGACEFNTNSKIPKYSHSVHLGSGPPVARDK